MIKFYTMHIIHHQGILSDLFPGIELPEHDYGILQSAIEDAARDKGLQVVPTQVRNCIASYTHYPY